MLLATAAGSRHYGAAWATVLAPTSGPDVSGRSAGQRGEGPIDVVLCGVYVERDPNPAGAYRRP